MQLVNHNLLRSFWFKSVERVELFQRRLAEGDSFSKSGAENFGESTRSDEISNDHNVLAYIKRRAENVSAPAGTTEGPEITTYRATSRCL